MPNIPFIVPDKENVAMVFAQALDAQEEYLLVIHDPTGYPPYFCESLSKENGLPMARRTAEQARMRILMELDTRRDFNEQWKEKRLSAMN